MKDPVIIVFLVLMGVLSAQSVVPTNDNYTNRIVLTGNDVSFSGTLAEATRESNPLEFTPQFLSGATQTVWWTWTASESSTAILQVLNSSQDTHGSDGLAVYLETVSQLQMEKAGGRQIQTQFPHNFFAFPVAAGSNYQIQLAGSDSASFNFRLVMTNMPFIIAQPRSQTITAGDSALFSVVGAGLRRYHYQWQLNETNLPGETFSILLLSNVTSNQVGPYRVVVTNTAGTTISDTANLFLTPADLAPSLIAKPPSGNQFAFTVSGEVGRRYRVESSTNLSAWFSEASFPSTTGINLKSVVINSTGTDTFSLTNAASEKFFRVSAFHAANEVCNNNLKQLRAAGLLWAYDNSQGPNSAVTTTHCIPYFRLGDGGWLPPCPAGGTYTTTTILTGPKCSLAASQGHTFEEP